MTYLEKRNHQVNTIIISISIGIIVIISIIIIIVVMKITWTGCCSDLTASAAEIEPTLDRWTARSGTGPENNDEDDCGGDYCGYDKENVMVDSQVRHRA